MSPRYSRILYLVTDAARSTVETARRGLPDVAAQRIEVRPLPESAHTPTAAPTARPTATGKQAKR